MGRIAAAFRIFFRTLTQADTATQVEHWLSGKTPALPGSAAPVTAPPPPAPPKLPPAPTQNPAITLLAAFQREARLVDFLMEDLGSHPDAAIGAAAREVHREASKLLQRLFAVEPVIAAAEDSIVDVPPDHDAGRFRLTGQITGGTARGQLKHHGWEATRCDLPTFTGSEQVARVIAPAEVEIS